MSRQENIESFFGWLANQREDIDKLPEHFRRMLLLSLLDTLSKCAFPKERKNWERFVDFIDHYSDWKYKDYVSLPQLRYLLFEAEGCEELKREVEARIRNWPHGRILRPCEADPHLNELDRFRCGMWHEQIERARYTSLLWKMRNFAVHEFRSPGRGWAFSNDNTTPYYHGLLDEKGSFQSWELVIPCEVVSGIVKNCSENVKREFEQKGVDPYDDNHFKFG
ncbi:MAG TPA: hypothetical protein VMW16_15145 [Sedimentisphaerales bacterium]|nr:hypothetical protein [Sedimentisphaerales bacterium]